MCELCPLSVSSSVKSSVLSIDDNRLFSPNPEVAVTSDSKRKINDSDSIDGDSNKKMKSTAIKWPEWFDTVSINNNEICYFPQLGSLTMHKDSLRLRNEIINIYQRNPITYLSSFECRQKIAGDVSFIVSIHAFLDAFGIINYHIKTDSRPQLTSFHLIPLNSDKGSNNILTPIDSVLLGEISKYGENWIKIAEIMKSHECEWTAEQCMAKFASLQGLQKSHYKNNIFNKHLDMKTDNKFMIQIYGDAIDLRVKSLKDKINLMSQNEIMSKELVDKMDTEMCDEIK